MDIIIEVLRCYLVNHLITILSNLILGFRKSRRINLDRTGLNFYMSQGSSVCLWFKNVLKVPYPTTNPSNNELYKLKKLSELMEPIKFD